MLKSRKPDPSDVSDEKMGAGGVLFDAAAGSLSACAFCQLPVNIGFCLLRNDS